MIDIVRIGLYIDSDHGSLGRVGMLVVEGHVLIEAAMFWLAYCMRHHDACGGAEA